MPTPARKMQKVNATAQAAVLPKIPPVLLDQLVKGPMTADAVEDAARALKKALIEPALGAEMSHHLGYAADADKSEAATDHCNGKSGKTVLTDDGRCASRCRETAKASWGPSPMFPTEDGK